MRKLILSLMLSSASYAYSTTIETVDAIPFLELQSGDEVELCNELRCEIQKVQTAKTTHKGLWKRIVLPGLLLMVPSVEGGPVAGAIGYWATKAVGYGTAAAAAGTAVGAAGGAVAGGAAAGAVGAGAGGVAGSAAAGAAGAAAGSGMTAAGAAGALVAVEAAGGVVAGIETASTAVGATLFACPFLP